MAKAREVAALCARITTNIAKAVGINVAMTVQFQSTLGRPRCGRPLGTAPTTCTCLSSPNAQAYNHGADRRDQGSRNLLRNHFEADDDHQHAKRHRQFVAVDLPELLKVVPELPQVPWPPPFKPNIPAISPSAT